MRCVLKHVRTMLCDAGWLVEQQNRKSMLTSGIGAGANSSDGIGGGEGSGLPKGQGRRAGE